MAELLLIGRHQGAEIPGHIIKETRSVTWPATSVECLEVLTALIEEATEKHLALVLQNMPGQVAAALCNSLRPSVLSTVRTTPVGVVVNKPGERPVRIVKEFYVDPGCIWPVVDALETANPSAKVEPVFPEAVNASIILTVTPAMRFEFSRIEWM